MSPGVSIPSLLPADTRSPGMRGLIACVASLVAFLGFWLVQARARRQLAAHHDDVDLARARG